MARTARLPLLPVAAPGRGVRRAPGPAASRGSAEKLARLAALFHALSDPTRLAILARLALGEQCVCQLTDLLSAGQSRLSFHLRALKEAGLVTDRREGRWVYYALAPEAVADLLDHATDLCCPPKPDAEGEACCRT